MTDYLAWDMEPFQREEDESDRSSSRYSYREGITEESGRKHLVEKRFNKKKALWQKRSTRPIGYATHLLWRCSPWRLSNARDSDDRTSNAPA
jgi:hypothetical protein